MSGSYGRKYWDRNERIPMFNSAAYAARGSAGLCLFRYEEWLRGCIVLSRRWSHDSELLSRSSYIHGVFGLERNDFCFSSIRM